MVRRQSWLAPAFLGILAMASGVFAQAPPPAGAVPAPLTPFGSGGAAAPGAASELPAPVLPPRECETPLGECGTPLGWFIELEAGAISPRIDSLKTSRDGLITFVSQVRHVDLDWGAVAEIDAGYRFDFGGGIRFAWRTFSSSATTTESGADAFDLEPFMLSGLSAALAPVPGVSMAWSLASREQHTQLQVDRFDVDYISAQHALGPFRWDWCAGLRTTILQLSTEVTDSFTLTVTETPPNYGIIPFNAPPGYQPPSIQTISVPLVFHQSASTTTAGFGAHLGAGGAWELGNGLALFGRADGAVLGGVSQQHYAIAVNGRVVVPEIGADLHGGAVLEMCELRAGVQYTLPLERLWLRLSAGYQFEAIWFRASGSGASDHALFTHIDLLDHGPFARCEMRF
jgi:hypothetical protein